MLQASPPSGCRPLFGGAPFSAQLVHERNADGRFALACESHSPIFPRRHDPPDAQPQRITGLPALHGPRSDAPMASMPHVYAASLSFQWGGHDWPCQPHRGALRESLAFNRTSPSNRPSCSMIQLCGCFAMASSHCSTVASVGGNKAGTVSEALGSTPNICTIAGSKPRGRRSATSLGSGFRSVRPYRSKLV
jgi:hypothetical protein